MPSDQPSFSPDELELRARIMGMGSQSMRKSYYPALQHRIDELERNRKLLNRAHEGIFLLAMPSFRIIDFNHTACTLLAVAPDQVTNRCLTELLPEKAVQPLNSWLDGLRPGEWGSSQFTFQINITAPDGAECTSWLELSMSVIETEAHRNLVGILRDVTTFHQQNEALQNSERMLHAIFDNSFQFTAVLTTAGVLAAINQTALKAIDETEEQVLGRNFWDTPWWSGLAEEQKKLTAGLQRCLRGETVRFHCVNSCMKGRKIWVDFSLKPLRDEKGQTIMLIAEGRDVTEMRLLQEQIQQSQKMDSIGQLAGGVAHDFNNILGGIIGAADLLPYMGALNEEQEKLVRLILSAAANASELTNKLLAFARKEKTVSTAIDVHEIIEEVKLLLDRSIDKRISVVLSLEAQRHRVVGDPAQMKSAFLNLGINARDAMPKGGRFEISTELATYNTQQCEKISTQLIPGEYIVIRFCDTGCGISEENLSRIFEPFFTTKEVGKGTGLGLAAVYGMANSHHGAITVQSEVGAGTCFFLHLPLEADAICASEKIPDMIEAHHEGTILVVDDERINRTTTKLMLEKMGFVVLLAENGKAGVSMYRQHQDCIKAVLLDLVMPEMNGEDAFVELRTINPTVQIVIMSGFTADISVRRLMDMGAAGYIHKPFRYGELVAALESM